MPQVSIIVPAYNAERFIRKTLDAILSQTYRDFEVIVVDDGSKDQTAALVQSYGPRVSCIQQPNGGVSRARNTGVAKASGRYLAFHDADDLWEPTKLEKQVALLDSRPETGLCFAGVQRIDPNDKPVGETIARDYPDFCEALLLYSCVVSGSCSSAMVRREVVESAGVFDPTFSTCADWEYWLRLSLLTRFAPVAEPLVRYRVSPGSMSSDPALVERDTFAVLNKFFSSDPPEKYVRLKDRVYSNHWMILAGCHLHAGRLKDSVRCVGRGLSLYPPNIVRPMGMPGRWLKRLLFPGPVTS
ncbi:MAG TPA: glycosyltransferase [Blastocatellia bacterium]|nr:glycosyltransferase [Blastocatellia bacterium]